MGVLENDAGAGGITLHLRILDQSGGTCNGHRGNRPVAHHAPQSHMAPDLQQGFCPHLMLGMCKYEQLLLRAKLPEGGPAVKCCDKENTGFGISTAPGSCLTLDKLRCFSGRILEGCVLRWVLPGCLGVGNVPPRAPHANAAAC